MSKKQIGNKNAEKWPLSHCEAMREFVGQNLNSYSGIARLINERFGTAYTRNSAIGKALRMGLLNKGWKVPVMQARSGEPRKVEKRPAFASAINRKVVILRCAEIEPRNLTLMQLGANDCRYPYGDGPHVFCGHPQTEGSSYCAAHFRLCTGYGTVSERRATS